MTSQEDFKSSTISLMNFLVIFVHEIFTIYKDTAKLTLNLQGKYTDTLIIELMRVIAIFRKS